MEDRSTLFDLVCDTISDVILANPPDVAAKAIAGVYPVEYSYQLHLTLKARPKVPVLSGLSLANEERGLQPATFYTCDEIVPIPGNVVATAAILLHALVRP